MVEENKVVKKRKKRKVAPKSAIILAPKAVAEPTAKDIEKIKRPLPLKQLAYIGGGATSLVVGFIIATAWAVDRSSLLLTMGVIIFWPGGAYLLYRGLKKTDSEEVVIVGADKPTSIVNSLNIYAIKDEETDKIYPQKVVFEWVEKPKGQPQQCLNNNRWYYVHIWDIEKLILKAFTLPDTQYFDPREFANVIVMPAHKKLFERQATFMQKIGPFVMVLAFMASIFGMLVTTPPG